MYKGVLFDLDGTLLDTSEGVKKSIRYTVSKMGLKDLQEKELDSFIGPPIYHSLKNKFNLSELEAKKGTEIFRDVYKEKYLLEATVYPGVFEFMQWLKENDIIIGVATYKREDYALKILEHFKIANYCDIIVGSDFENKMTKTDIVAKCYVDMQIKKNEAVLIGDTIHDANGAKNFGIDFIAVTYGFGFRDKSELEQCECKAIVGKISDIKKLLSESAKKEFKLSS